MTDVNGSLSANGYLKEHTNPPVFIISAVMVLAFVTWGVAAPGHLGDVAGAVMAWISSYFGWWYVLSVTGFLIFVIVLMVSRYGNVRIGKDDDKPEWSTSRSATSASGMTCR